MADTIWDGRHRALVAILRAKRLEANLHQEDVARALGKKQPFIAKLEGGDRRIDVIELIRLGEILGFDPRDVLDQLGKHKEALSKPEESREDYDPLAEGTIEEIWQQVASWDESSKRG